ncbi:acyl carrier protein [Kineococcus glutinatus]|uniref:Acyl carrier protein n=1 Tax=Kineococcus glutinatus TaxID=1070872 RepID=A0ABP9HMB8_9ACTN
MSTQQRMQEVVREVLGDDELVLRDEMTAADVPGWDSLAHINIMFTLEQEFDVRFSDDQLASFRDVGELRRFLEQAAAA